MLACPGTFTNCVESPFGIFSPGLPPQRRIEKMPPPLPATPNKDLPYPLNRGRR